MDLILSSILGPVCERVFNTAIEEYRLVRDVKEEIMNLRRTVSMIKKVLEDAERKKDDRRAIGEWLKSLKQVMFDAEDVFDEIATDEALGRDAEDGTSRLSKVCKLISDVDISSSRHAIAHRVKDIYKKLDAISKDKESLGLLVSDETNLPVIRSPPNTSSLLPKGAHIIGRDDEMRKIKELLLLEYSVEGTVATTSDYNKNVDVINVVGMGGVGKTTLVQHAYNNTDVGNYFQLRMWVCVSNYFDVKTVTREIMEAAEFDFKKTRDKFADPLNWDVVQKSLQNKLEGKRFLLVLDDVWEEDPKMWDCLCTPLMYGGKGSKIIVTTRSQKVASITKGISIFLKDLPSDDLWSIFQIYAFDRHDLDKDQQLVIVGRKIVDKLKGSPLAAKTIGRLLNSNLNVKHWKNTMKSETWLSLDSKNSIVPILKLSYDYLPGHLKQCFAYCSLFPEDHRFYKDELVKLWMAHQFIIQIREGFFHVESDGGEYFDDLVCMSLFEKCTDKFGRERFVMHDLIHNLAEIVSEGDCLRLEDNQQNGTIPDTVRHVSIASDIFDLPKIKQLCNKYENMRTLLFLCGCKFQPDSHLDSIFMKLQRLRVLGLKGCNINKLPVSIGTLKHLRFLDLSNTFISELPDSLCNLHNLQVLNLKDCQQLRALPRNMSALINLRHLYANDELVCGIQGLGKLTALHELTFDCGIQPMKELADMGMLRRLRIWGLREVKSREVAAESRLDKKEHLDELELGWRELKRPWHNDDDVNHPGLEEEVLDSLQPPHSSIRRLAIYNYGGTRSPSWMEEDQLLSSSLEALDLSLCRNWKVLPPLGLLLCLHSLKIERMRRVRRIGPAFMGCCRQLPQGGFPSLQVLEFKDMPEWEEWEVPLLGTDADDGGEDDQVFLARLRLRELRIVHCPKLRQLPPLPPTLTMLYIHTVGLTHWPGWLLQPSSSSSSPSSLCSLNIFFCPNLEGDDDGEDDQVFSEAPPPPPPQQHHRRRPLFLAPLRELTIGCCPKLRQLPPLPPTLTKLEIRLSGLTRLPRWRLLPSSSSSSSSPSPHSLCSLEIVHCPNLEGNDDGEDDQVLSEAPPQPLFLALLRELTIKSCPKLRQLPPLPPTLTKLYLSEVGLTHLPEWLPPSSLPSSYSSSPSLSSLQIRGCPELTSLADGLLRHSLPNLVKLEIINCRGLVSLPPDTAFGHLTSLKELEVERCPKLAWASTCESPSVEDSGLPPSLESITIQGGWGEVMDQMMLAIVSSGQKLACLRKLHVLGPRMERPRMERSRGSCGNMFWQRCRVSIETCPAVTPPPPPTLRRSLPSSLQELTICDMDQLDDETLSAWLRGLTSLRELSIEKCPAVTSLPRADVLSHLTALKKLEITSLKALSSFGGGIHCLVSLERLTITEGCFFRPPPTTLRRSLPSSLQQLTIWKNDQLDDETLSAWLRGLTSLRELDISWCPAVTSLPRAEVLSHLTELQKLEIRGLKALSSFGGGVHCLVSLEELTIFDCPELLDIATTAADSSGPSSSSSALPRPARSSVGTSTTRIRKLEINGSSMQQMIKTWLLQCPSLQELRIHKCPQLTGFGDDGGDVGGELEAALLNLSGTLQRLELWRCENLRSLPPRLRCLSSLQSLSIQYCPQIRSLPVAGLPESMRDLRISGCPALEELCKEGVGSDWPLISHIPEKWIGNQIRTLYAQ